MSKVVTGLFLTVVVAAPAMAGFIHAVPAPETTGGILGMAVAAGVAYLLTRRSRT